MMTDWRHFLVQQFDEGVALLNGQRYREKLHQLEYNRIPYTVTDSPYILQLKIHQKIIWLHLMPDTGRQDEVATRSQEDEPWQLVNYAHFINKCLLMLGNVPITPVACWLTKLGVKHEYLTAAGYFLVNGHGKTVYISPQLTSNGNMMVRFSKTGKRYYYTPFRLAKHLRGETPFPDRRRPQLTT